MSTKLSTITTQYRRFTKNQVLTEGNLNEVVDFFDDQDRLTRIYLSGVGIVCGFTVSFNNELKTITVSQGTGITTDGDLFKLYKTDDNGEKTIDFIEKQFKYCKVYDNSKAKYKPFFYDGNNQLSIYELLTVEQQLIENDDYFSLNDFESNTTFGLQDAVVILYLETYEKELDLCVSLSCDNQGLETISNFKMLIVSKEVATQINSHDSIISKTNYSNLYESLPNVISNRIVLNPKSFINYDTIKQIFTQGIFKNDVLDNLLMGYETLLNALQMPVFLNAIKTNLNSLFSFTDSDVPPDFQYRYDLLNDIVATYTETKNLLFNMDGGYCCPDINAFPRHLMLGELYKSGACFEFRHAFYKSPLLSGQNLSTCNDCLTYDDLIITGTEEIIDEQIVDFEGNEIKICFGENTAIQKLFSLIKRTAQLLENYNVNFNTIKITPSLQHGKLGKKAIPFYNNVGNSLIQVWDFDKTVLGNQRDTISYHDNLLNTKKPLEIHIDSDFYRIEGHQGLNYKEALKTIQEIRQENGLGFNVVTIGVNATDAQEIMDGYTSFYLKKNHGYEHKAGVAPGGTFLMVYIIGEYDRYPYGYGYGYPYEYPNSGASLAGDFETLGDGTTVILNPVIADFTLPYLCCDENFITLSLPVKTICFDSQTKPFPFHVTPNGGYVKADVEEGLNGGVQINQYGEFVFNPNLVSEELIGEPITFTVNNFETDCIITIYRKPAFDFQYKIIGNPGRNQTKIQFEIINENTVGNEYSWDFGDDTDVIITGESIIEYTYNYSSPETINFSFNVKVTGNNGNCNLEVMHPVTFEIANPSISLEKTKFCKNDRGQYVFIITPPDPNTLIEGYGVSKSVSGNNAGKLVFIPNTVPTSINAVTFNVNGVPSNLTVTLNEPPLASFTTTLDTEKITFNNLSQNAQKYVWKIDQETIEIEDATPITKLLSMYNSESIEVSLLAESDVCGESLDGPRNVVIRLNDSQNRCLDSASKFILDSRQTITTVKSSTPFKTFSNATKLLVNTIEEQLIRVQGKTSDYINGNNNGEIPEIFSTDIFDQIKLAIKAKPSNQETIIIQMLVKMETSFYYTFLKCQEQIILKEFEGIIAQTDVFFTELFADFVKIEFNIDKDGSLKQFLNEMLLVFDAVQFIKTDIDNQLIELTNVEKF